MSITDRDRKLLWGRAHNQCAFPGCIQTLTPEIANAITGDDDAIIIGDEAHIRAQSPGGPRYVHGYKEVDSYDNLLLLCKNHHRLVDANDGAGFSIDKLLKIKRDHEGQLETRAALKATLRAYIGERYTAENTVQFHQANLTGPSVDAMFVDVPVGARRDGSRLHDLLESIATTAPGDTTELELTSDLVVTGAAQALLDPGWSGNAILVGGPGQGKSTVLQYVCQFHRARRLNIAAYGAELTNLARTNATSRFPIRVDLRKYAQWAMDQVGQRPRRGKKKPKHKFDAADDPSWPSLERYLIDDVQRHVGAYTFRAEEFAALVASEPLLLAFDGLDEVANVRARTRVATEIARTRSRLAPNAADLVVLVATRPGSSLQPLTADDAFPVLHLQRLTQGLRVQYLRQWIKVSGLQKDAADRLQSTFLDSQHVPHIIELASYPMQLAILLHLLHQRQLLPQRRTDLYAGYLQTFLDREQTEEKEPMLATERRIVEDTHAYLGWYIQTKAEKGESSGSVTHLELQRLLREYLVEKPEDLKLADKLYSAITYRVLCLIEREDAFEFEVQSLREYFAALYIFDNLTTKGHGNSRDDGLNALLQRPYWANVCRFYVGMLTKGEIRAVKDNLETVEKLVSPAPTVRVMAANILSDRNFEGHSSSDIRRIVDIILRGPGVILAEDGVLDSAGTPLRFSERAGRTEAVAHLQARLEQGTEDHGAALAIASSLARHAVASDAVSRWWWQNFSGTTQWFAIGATLGAFDSVSAENARQLHAAYKENDSDTRWYASLLAEGGYDGTDPELLHAVALDLNEGAVENVEVPNNDSHIGRLIRDALSVLPTRPRRRPRTRRTPSPQYPALETAQHAAQVAEQPFDRSSHAEWLTRLTDIAKAWGDGWLTQRAVSAVPAALDLSRMAADVRGKNPHLTTTLRLEHEYRSHTSDASWWRPKLKATSARERSLTLLALFQRARREVVIELAATIDSCVQQLTPKRYRALERALRDDINATQNRTLDLQDALRLHRISVSGRTLWLLRTVVTDATRQRLDAQLDTTLDDILHAGTSYGREAITASNSPRKLKLESIRGARSTLPPGGWATDSRLPALGLTTSRAILSEPQEWPADLVHIATEQLSIRSADKTDPLVAVAVTNAWFETPH